MSKPRISTALAIIANTSELVPVKARTGTSSTAVGASTAGASASASASGGGSTLSCVRVVVVVVFVSACESVAGYVVAAGSVMVIWKE